MYLSIKSVAARYEVTVDCIRKWVAADKFPAPMRINGAARWRLSDIEDWEKTK